MNRVPAVFITALIDVAQDLARRGWLRATSGNLSLRDVQNQIIYITRSGVDKQRLAASDIIGITPDGVLIAGEGKPSFETAIHQAIYARTSAQAVLHVHTVYNNLVSRYAADGAIALTDHEMLKALGHWDENARVALPVVSKYYDIGRAAPAVAQALNPDVPGVLLARHGIYAFGESLTDAVRHLEAWEFLLEWLCLEHLAQASQQRAATAEHLVP